MEVAATRFKSKIVEIEAWEFTSIADLENAPEWLRSVVKHVTREPRPGEVVPFVSPIDVSDLMAIGTLEGRMIAGVGDWIIRGTEGELYPCKPSVFERKYEPIDPRSG
jgi:hypothetical protein